jgi:hypothetical protein
LPVNLKVVETVMRDHHPMRLNDRIREHVADELPDGEQIVAAVALSNQIGTVRASGDGAVRSSGTALGTPYARSLGIDLTDRRHRSDLMGSLCTLTDRRMLFHEPHPWRVRPTPRRLLAEMPYDDVTLHYFDVGGFGLSNRVFHLDFPDGTRLLTATMLKASLRKQNYSDEPDLFVQAFGDRATAVDVD